jgi:hypothetical protein
VRERRVERWLTSGQRLEALGFGSGGGLTALVVRSPRAYHQFSYFEPEFPTGGLVADEGKVSPDVPLRAPTDVVGITADGIVMYLDESTGAVKTSSMSNQRVLVVALDTMRAVQSACAVNAGTIAFIERDRPGNVFVRETDRDVEHAITVSLDPDSSGATWSDMRLNGSLGSGCALWSRTGRRIAVLTPGLIEDLSADTASREAVHTMPTWPVAREHVPWYDRVWRFLSGVGTRRCDPREQRDVTTLPGMIAVLTGCGNVIKVLAMDDGEYIEGMQLSHSGLRIAGAGQRLFSLRQAGDSVFLASYIVPPASRARVRTAEALGTAPPPPAWLRALREELP